MDNDGDFYAAAWSSIERIRFVLHAIVRKHYIII